MCEVFATYLTLQNREIAMINSKSLNSPMLFYAIKFHITLTKNIVKVMDKLKKISLKIVAVYKRRPCPKKIYIYKNFLSIK